MRLAAKTVLDKLQEDPTILPDNITVDAVYTLLNFSLDKLLLQIPRQILQTNNRWTHGIPAYSRPSRDTCN